MCESFFSIQLGNLPLLAAFTLPLVHIWCAVLLFWVLPEAFLEGETYTIVAATHVCYFLHIDLYSPSDPPFGSLLQSTKAHTTQYKGYSARIPTLRHCTIVPPPGVRLDQKKQRNHRTTLPRPWTMCGKGRKLQYNTPAHQVGVARP